MRVVVLDDYLEAVAGSAPWDRLDADLDIVDTHLSDEAELAARIGDAEVLVVTRERTPITRTLLVRLPHLRLLVTTAMRNAAIDMQAAADAGLTVCGTRGNKRSTIEMTWALLLALVRDLPANEESLRRGEWQSTLGTSLEGKTIGLLGLGTVGEGVARIARAMDMNVIAWSSNLTFERAEACGATLVGRDDLFASSDILSIHVVLSDRTRLLVRERELALMPRGSYLVNTSRAGIVDTDALVRALESGHLAGAALDVYDREPLTASDPLLAAPRTVLTPHLGYVTREEFRLFYGDVVEDIEAWLRGEPLRVLSSPVTPRGGVPTITNTR